MNAFPESLWDFSLSLYARPKMESLCLALQDQHGINVNLLLWALWLDGQARPFDLGLWRKGVARSGRVQYWVVGPLRRTRKAVPKRKPWLGLRSAVKYGELLGEKWQLQKLQHLADACSGSARGNTGSAEEHPYLAQLLRAHDAEYQQLKSIYDTWAAESHPAMPQR